MELRWITTFSFLIMGIGVTIYCAFIKVWVVESYLFYIPWLINIIYDIYKIVKPNRSKLD